MQVDSANKHGILLEVVQILTDLNLIVTKAYISSDGGWFMDGNPPFSLFVSVCIYHCEKICPLNLLLCAFEISFQCH